MNGTGARRVVVLAAATVLVQAGALVPASSAVAAPAAGAGPGRVLVVDDDGAQCPEAGFTLVQDALDDAGDGDRVRVCAGDYRETLTVGETVTVQGEVGAVASLDCLDPSATTDGDLDTTRFAVVRPPAGPQADGALVRIAADAVELAGLVVEGRIDTVIEEPVPGATLYDAAVSVSDEYTGIRLRHNMFRLNTLGVELGASDSRVDHNCFRDNRWGLANQRYVLKRARIHDTTTTGAEVITWEVGWFYRGTEDVRLDHNVSDEENFYVAYVDHSTRAQVVANDIHATGQGIRINSQNVGVEIVGNTVTGAAPGRGQAGVVVGTAGTRPATTGLEIRQNVVRRMEAPGVNTGIGIQIINGARQTDAVIVDNLVTSSASEGWVLGPGNNGNEIVRNILSDSGTNGIRLSPATTMNVLRDNVALGNTTDARDLALLATGVTPASNQWVNTT